MAVSPIPRQARRLREAIEAYRTGRTDGLSGPARELLDRLYDSDEAAKAFERLELKQPQQEAEVLEICLEADELTRTFPQWQSSAEALIDRAKTAEKTIAQIHKFIDGVEPKVPLPSDLLTLSIFDPPADIAKVRGALELVADWIDWRRGIAEFSLAQCGITRKARTPEAIENTAIWWLGSRIQGVRGKRENWSDLADLAQVVLQSEISVDRLTNLVRNRRDLYAKAVGIQTERHSRSMLAKLRRP